MALKVNDAGFKSRGFITKIKKKGIELTIKVSLQLLKNIILQGQLIQMESLTQMYTIQLCKLTVPSIHQVQIVNGATKGYSMLKDRLLRYHQCKHSELKKKIDHVSRIKL